MLARELENPCVQYGRAGYLILLGRLRAPRPHLKSSIRIKSAEQVQLHATNVSDISANDVSCRQFSCVFANKCSDLYLRISNKNSDCFLFWYELIETPTFLIFWRYSRSLVSFFEEGDTSLWSVRTERLITCSSWSTAAAEPWKLPFLPSIFWCGGATNLDYFLPRNAF